MTATSDRVAAADLRAMYRAMLLIRRIEEKVLECLLQGRLSSTMCHVSIGQEAVAAGVCAALGADDYISSTHRGHGHFLARGGDPGALMAELYGRADGACLGRGGSMHLVDVTRGHLGSNAIVGGHIPIATGAALWSALRGDGRVAVPFFGDGATTEGIFHECVNMAAVWKLPVVFVVENNQYAMSMPWEHAVAEQSLAVKATTYGVAGEDVDGQDVAAVCEATMRAVDRARSGGGPTLLGLHTYGFLGHSRGDPSAYRDPAEEEAWQARDPLTIAAQRLVTEHGLEEAELDRIDGEIGDEVERAVAFAEKSPVARLESVFSDVYATGGLQ